MKKSRQQELADFKNLIESLEESDFDGHTDFQKLTAKQKLEWLSQLIVFVRKVKK